MSPNAQIFLHTKAGTDLNKASAGSRAAAANAPPPFFQTPAIVFTSPEGPARDATGVAVQPHHRPSADTAAEAMLRQGFALEWTAQAGTQHLCAQEGQPRCSPAPEPNCPCAGQRQGKHLASCEKAAGQHCRQAFLVCTLYSV